MKKSSTAKKLFNYVADVMYPHKRVQEFDVPNKAKSDSECILRPILKPVNGKLVEDVVYKKGKLVAEPKVVRNDISGIFIPAKTYYCEDFLCDPRKDGRYAKKVLMQDYKYVTVQGTLTYNPIDSATAIFVAHDIKVANSSKSKAEYPLYNAALNRSLLLQHGFICVPWWLLGNVYTDKETTIAHANFILEQARRQGWVIDGVEKVNLVTRETTTVVRRPLIER